MNEDKEEKVIRIMAAAVVEQIEMAFARVCPVCGAGKQATCVGCNFYIHPERIITEEDAKDLQS